MNDHTQPKAKRASRGTADAIRAASIAGFDDLPDSALVSVPIAAKVNGQGESSYWQRAKSEPGFPPIIKLSPRCSRVRVGDLRAYLAKLGAAEPLREQAA